MKQIVIPYSPRMSNIKNFKYDWIWKKKYSTGYLNAKKQPLRNEIILFL